MAEGRALAGKLVPRRIGRSILLTKRLLVDTGFARSRDDRIVDAEENPLPWYTFPAIEYLDSLELSHASVLEFGSGSSTLFWERRVRSIVSVEHDPDWHETVKPKLASQTRYILATDEESYINPVGPEALFDVLIVDGLYRRRCIDTALRHRANGGIVVLDNSDWYPDVASELRSKGLIQVDFAGFGPLLSHTWTTSVWLDGQNPPSHVEGAPRMPMASSSFSAAMRERVAAEPGW